MLSGLISKHYGLEVNELKLLDSHFGTEIYLLEANKNKYIVKTLPIFMSGVENEGNISEYLLDNGVKVAKFLKTNEDKYFIKTDDMQFHVQEFIDGNTLGINTAPNWFLNKSASVLGRVHQLLKGYGELRINFDRNFFNKATVNEAILYYSEKLNESYKQNHTSLVSELKERIQHLEKISTFNIDTSKLTYVNSHGDYHIGQIITKNKNITVIDWTSACCLPAALEVITSYTMASPKCKNGNIDCVGIRKYVENYSIHSTLTQYDLIAMPYIFYFQQIMCHYQPPYDAVADTYKPICNLINSFTNWLCKNVEALSNELNT